MYRLHTFIDFEPLLDVVDLEFSETKNKRFVTITARSLSKFNLYLGGQYLLCMFADNQKQKDDFRALAQFANVKKVTKSCSSDGRNLVKVKLQLSIGVENMEKVESRVFAEYIGHIDELKQVEIFSSNIPLMMSLTRPMSVGENEHFRSRFFAT